MGIEQVIMFERQVKGSVYEFNKTVNDWFCKHPDIKVIARISNTASSGSPYGSSTITSLMIFYEEVPPQINNNN